MLCRHRKNHECNWIDANWCNFSEQKVTGCIRGCFTKFSSFSDSFLHWDFLRLGQTRLVCERVPLISYRNRQWQKTYRIIKSLACDFLHGFFCIFFSGLDPEMLGVSFLPEFKRLYGVFFHASNIYDGESPILLLSELLYQHSFIRLR